jgi:hypothetical protein
MEPLCFEVFAGDNDHEQIHDWALYGVDSQYFTKEADFYRALPNKTPMKYRVTVEKVDD